jgi:hypothetical protein
VVAALVTYRVASVPAVAAPVVNGSQVSLVDPAQQSVMSYLHIRCVMSTFSELAVELTTAIMLARPSPHVPASFSGMYIAFFATVHWLVGHNAEGY